MKLIKKRRLLAFRCSGMYLFYRVVVGSKPVSLKYIYLFCLNQVTFVPCILSSRMSVDDKALMEALRVGLPGLST